VKSSVTVFSVVIKIPLGVGFLRYCFETVPKIPKIRLEKSFFNFFFP